MVENHGIPIRVISHNIRYSPEELSTGEAPWRTRLPLLAAHFRYHTAHSPGAFICMQELLYPQLIDLLAMLNSTPDSPLVIEENPPEPEWDYIGVGRDDGKMEGEHCAIFFRPSLWQPVSVDTVWLSPHPTTPGTKYPGAGSPRLVTLGHFCSKLDLEPPAELLVANTHLDDQSEEARQMGAQTISKLLKAWRDGQVPIILAGDLNSTESQGGYQELTRQGSPVMDTMSLTAPYTRYGEFNTYTGFEGKKEDLQRIDYVFAGPRDLLNNAYLEDDSVSIANTWKINNYAVLPNRFDDSDGIYHSDHRAVVVDLTLKSICLKSLRYPYSKAASRRSRVIRLCMAHILEQLFPGTPGDYFRKTNPPSEEGKVEQRATKEEEWAAIFLGKNNAT